MPSSARLLKLTTGWCWTCVSKILIRLWSLVAPSVAPQLETLISFMFRAAVLLMVPPPWNTNGHTYRISTNTFLNIPPSETCSCEITYKLPQNTSKLFWNNMTRYIQALKKLYSIVLPFSQLRSNWTNFIISTKFHIFG